jgi:type IV pilus assembly protein PilX
MNAMIPQAVFSRDIHSNQRMRVMRPSPSRERGVVLVVALLLLVVVTLVGFAAVRGTIMQQKMAANHYDRQIAFQSAEAALRAAKLRITANPGDIARNCRTGSSVCLSNPFNDPSLPTGSIHEVGQGTADGEFTKASVAASQPQYVIENMGNWADPTSDTGFDQSANSYNYGNSGGSTTAVYYRITARSGDPAAVGDRAVVVLQAIVKQR